MEFSRWALLGWPVLTVLALLAWFLGSPLVYLAVILLAVAALAGWVWSKWGLVRVEYSRRVTPDRCFAGEPITLELELVNRKLLPVSDLAVDDELPEQFELRGRKVSVARLRRTTLRHLFTASWYMRIRRRYTLVPSKRGLFRIGPATITGADPFGMREGRVEVPGHTQVIVYPKVLPLPRIGLPSRRPFGDLKSYNRLFPDPLRVAGGREYQPGDPLSRIHWKMTAACGRLQVKELEPSAQGGLAVFLNLWGFGHIFEGYDSEALERGVIAAAAAAGWAVENNLAVGLFANGIAEGWAHTLRLPPAQGPDVLGRILEGLARLAPPSQQPIAQLMSAEVSSLGYGTAILLVTPTIAADVAATLAWVRAKGHPVTVLTTGARQEHVSLRGIRIYAYQQELDQVHEEHLVAGGGAR